MSKYTVICCAIKSICPAFFYFSHPNWRNLTVFFCRKPCFTIHILLSHTHKDISKAAKVWALIELSSCQIWCEWVVEKISRYIQFVKIIISPSISFIIFMYTLYLYFYSYHVYMCMLCGRHILLIQCE